MKSVKAKGTKALSASAVDGVVILSIKTTVRDEHFALAAPDVSVLVMRLLAAQNKAAERDQRLPPALVAGMSTVAISQSDKMVTLSLMPSENSHLPFSLTATHARKIAASLLEAANSLEPQGSNKAH